LSPLTPAAFATSCCSSQPTVGLSLALPLFRYSFFFLLEKSSVSPPFPASAPPGVFHFLLSYHGFLWPPLLLLCSVFPVANALRSRKAPFFRRSGATGAFDQSGDVPPRGQHVPCSLDSFLFLSVRSRPTWQLVFKRLPEHQPLLFFPAPECRQHRSFLLGQNTGLGRGF